jgi:hypothetical protein
MNRWPGRVLLPVFLIAASCSSPASIGTPGSFSSPAPPDEFASGLTIGFIPAGFAWGWNEGHETAKFHTFQTEDESQQLSVGIQMSPPSPSSPGETTTRNGREFIVYDSSTEIRVTQDIGNNIRIDVVSSTLDPATLLQVAESVQIQANTTSSTLTRADPGGLVVPDCDDSASCPAGFVLGDGVFYNLGCRAVREADVTSEVLGRGRLDDESVTVNAIEGIDRSVMVAVSLPGGLCEEGDQALSHWTGAFPPSVDDEALQEANCSVGELTEVQRIADGC